MILFSFSFIFVQIEREILTQQFSVTDRLPQSLDTELKSATEEIWNPRAYRTIYINKATTEIAWSVKSSFTLITLRQETTEVLGYSKKINKRNGDQREEFNSWYYKQYNKQEI